LCKTNFHYCLKRKNEIHGMCDGRMGNGKVGHLHRKRAAFNVRDHKVSHVLCVSSQSRCSVTCEILQSDFLLDKILNYIH